MQEKLTQAELSWLDMVFTQVNEELHETLSKLGSTPIRYVGSDPTHAQGLERVSERLRASLVKRAHAEDFIALEVMGRVRLSRETRKAEMKRLLRRRVKRKKYTFRYGRKHNKLKAKTRKEFNNRRWEKDPLERLRYTSRKPVAITQEEWDRCIGPVWSQYERKYLKLKCSAPKMTIHTLVIEYTPPRERYSRQQPKPVVVYDGYSQAVYDSFSLE